MAAPLAQSPGSPARFKQQRDPKTKGVEEWVHAHASRITYDEETDKVTLEGKAQLSRSENGQQKAARLPF